MNVFINDIPLIIKKNSEKVYKHKYDLILNPEDEFTSKDLVGDVLVRDVTDVFVDRLLRLMEVKKLKKLTSLTMLARKKSRLILHLKDQFRIVKAAGGLVVKQGKVLMIYRLGKWDLPKGKLKRDEDPGLGALREVEEECNIKVELGDELPSTWHSYAYNGNKILKKTNWYVMRCLDDTLMKPQAEEYIEEVRWMTPQEALSVLDSSYASIALVMRHYLSEMAGSSSIKNYFITYHSKPQCRRAQQVDLLRPSLCIFSTDLVSEGWQLERHEAVNVAAKTMNLADNSAADSR